MYGKVTSKAGAVRGLPSARGRAKALAGAVLAAAGTLALGAAPAQAKPIYLPELFAKGTNGYKIQVGGFRGVSVLATKGPRKRLLSASYDVRNGKSTGKVLRADLGRFGYVDMRFVPKGKPRKRMPRGCSGKPDLVQRGVWKGRLRFEGHNGFTKVNVRSARGKVTRFGVQNCEERGSAGGRFVELFAVRKRGKTQTFFGVEKRDRPSAKPSFSAYHRFKVGDVRVGLAAFYRGKPKQFIFSAPEPSGNADVNPKGPFSGSAAYSNGSWSGNLAVKLPGKRVKLTGRGFKASLGLTEEVAE